MPTPTNSKWEVPFTCCNIFAQLLSVAPGDVTKATMIEEFVIKCRSLMRGHTDEARPQDVGNHVHREKMNALDAVLSKPELIAG